MLSHSLLLVRLQSKQIDVIYVYACMCEKNTLMHMQHINEMTEQIIIARYAYLLKAIEADLTLSQTAPFFRSSLCPVYLSCRS